MRALKVMVVVMGLLIVAGVATIATVIVRRGMLPPVATAEAILHEPVGTRIAEAAAAADRLTLRLEGGGADRVVVLDLASGRVLGRVVLASP